MRLMERMRGRRMVKKWWRIKKKKEESETREGHRKIKFQIYYFKMTTEWNK